MLEYMNSFPRETVDFKHWLQKWKNQPTTKSPTVDWIGLRYYEENTQTLSVRNGVLQDNSVVIDKGVMIEVLVGGQLGYAGTCVLTDESLQRAFEKAVQVTQMTSEQKVFNFNKEVRPKAVGKYQTTHQVSLDQLSKQELISRLTKASERMKSKDGIVNAVAQARIVETRVDYHTTEGTQISQNFLLITPQISNTKQKAGQMQTRTYHGDHSQCFQAGLELFNQDELFRQCDEISEQVSELLEADTCPTDTRDLILSPDQMLIQIHESIGHPLELDRILGDERNFAGWSHVKPSDFGTLQYGSPLLNITFDPTLENEFASYKFDESGALAEKVFLIEKGVLKRGLGGLESQTRLNKDNPKPILGTANFRTASWNRAPIDRMANINLEPGTSSLKEMISQTEKGILMETNISWSIDDYRNKFQFGCEYGKLIENGQLTKTVRNPNYRGVSIPFWKSLKAVGSSQEVFGSPYCGKGEPSQVIRVGHASPYCLFSNIEVFGGG